MDDYYHKITLKRDSLQKPNIFLYVVMISRAKNCGVGVMRRMSKELSRKKSRKINKKVCSKRINSQSSVLYVPDYCLRMDCGWNKNKKKIKIGKKM